MNHPAIPRESTNQIIINGQIISYFIKRSYRAKHARLVVRGETGLTVVLPATFDKEQVPGLLKQKSQWILNNLLRYSQTPRSAGIKELRSGSPIPYLGKNVKIDILRLSTIPDSVRLQENRLLINLNNKNIKLSLAVEWWYRQQAEKLLRKKVAELCPRLGVTFGRICIKGAKTRWGSCSKKGNINLNWRLIMVPEPVIDYVVIHELCHLKEMNHSKKFWHLVGEHCPLWHKHRQWLKDHTTELSAKFSN